MFQVVARYFLTITPPLSVKNPLCCLWYHFICVTTSHSERNFLPGKEEISFGVLIWSIFEGTRDLVKMRCPIAWHSWKTNSAGEALDPYCGCFISFQN